MSNIIVTNTNDSGAESLRAAIAAAVKGDSISFAPSLAGQKIVLTSGEIAIPMEKSLVIDGAAAPGLVISGNNSSRIFSVSASATKLTDLTVKNLTLVDGKTTERGGAINTTDSVKLTVEKVIFSHNTADNGGGAIFTSFNSTLSVTDSQFNGNIATAGNNERGGGAISFASSGAITIINSDFNGNQGINGGAIYSNQGKLTVDNSRFVNNDTTAAFFATGKGTDFLRGFGGAIYTDRASSLTEASGSIKITNSVFDGNKGESQGGAAYLFTGLQDTVDISGTVFKNNQVAPLTGNPNSIGIGGGLVQMSDTSNKGFTLTNSSFSNNVAAGQAGALWVMNTQTTITNDAFTGNKVLGSANNNIGGAIAMFAPGTIVNSSFVDNVTGGQGGALWTRKGDFTTIVNSTFVGNQATSLNDYSNGGALAFHSPAAVINSTFVNNSAGWVGGAILADKGIDVSVANSVFLNNTGENGGNTWKIEQQTNRVLTDKGGNVQWLIKQIPKANDFSITTTAINADPKLDVLQTVNGVAVMPLLAGSPAIDAGVGTDAPALDARGQARVDGDGNGSIVADSGAYEYTVQKAMFSIAATDADKAEKAGGLVFTVNRTGNLTVASSVDWSVSGGNATFDDFAVGPLPTTSGTLSFAANETNKTITIPIADDTAFESDESFNVVLSKPVNAVLGTAFSATGTIRNDDPLTGTSGNDTLTGTSGNDWIIADAGTDMIDGDLSIDTLIYKGSLKTFVISKTTTTVIVQDSSGFSGMDTLKNIERLQFDDTVINLTIQTKAAPSNIAASDLKNIEELYVGFFKRIPDADGLGYWIDQLKAGKSIQQIADAFYDAGIQYGSVTGYSSSMTNEVFINLVYQNVLARTGLTKPTADEVIFWANQLNAGTQTRGSVVTSILNTVHTEYVNSPTWSWVGKLLDNKASVANKFAIEWGMNYLTPEASITKGVEIANAVTDSDITAALNLIGVNGVFI